MTARAGQVAWQWRLVRPFRNSAVDEKPQMLELEGPARSETKGSPVGDRYSNTDDSLPDKWISELWHVTPGRG